MSLFPQTTVHELAGATISDCGQYRYHLWRVWDEERPIMVFVMQNPSTADATDDDPTIRRCIGFARRDGCGGISVRNVFALRATDEREILTHPDPFGPENEDHLLRARSVSLMTKLVAAWGTRLGKRKSVHSTAYKKAACACSTAYCLGVTKRGDPRHPLFVRADAPLIPWTMPEYEWGCVARIGPDFGAHEANARLIASAPDMASRISELERQRASLVALCERAAAYARLNRLSAPPDATSLSLAEACEKAVAEAKGGKP